MDHWVDSDIRTICDAEYCSDNLLQGVVTTGTGRLIHVITNILVANPLYPGVGRAGPVVTTS